MECGKCNERKDASDTKTNKEVITAFRKKHETCKAVRIWPSTTG